MKRFVRSLGVLFLLGAIGSFPLFASDSKAKDQDKTKGKGRGKDKKAGSGELNVPIPLPTGLVAKGVNIPCKDEKGKLQMFFSMQAVKRLDQGHLEMQSVTIETYNPDGSREMSVEAKTSILDLSTRIVTSKERATIRRSDFEITGDEMQFNTKTRDGNMSGNVRMLIYNTSSTESDRE